MRHRIRLLTVFVGMLAFFTAGMPVQAATFTATNDAALRAAIDGANTNGEADIIDLGGSVITLSAELPFIESDITVYNGTIDGADNFRIFTVPGTGTLTVQNMTLRNGSGSSGGGIANSGTATVNNSTLSGNVAGLGGGGIYNSGTLTINNSILFDNQGGLNGGGGIENFDGTVTVSNSTISGKGAFQVGAESH